MKDLRVAPVLASVVFASLLVAGWAFTSLVLNQDVIVEKDAGPLLGPLMVFAATAIVWSALWGLRNRRGVTATAAGGTASVYCVMLLVGAIVYGISRGDLTLIILFVGRYATSPFIIVPAALAGLTIVVYWLVGARSPAEKPIDPSQRTD